MNNRYKYVVAVNLLLKQNKKLFLLKRKNTGHLDGMYNVVAGHVERNELCTTAMIREAKEEIGIQLEPLNLKMVMLVQRPPIKETEEGYIDIFFECSKWAGNIINSEPHKCEDIGWFSLDDLPKNTIPLLTKAIETLNEGNAYLEVTNN